MYEMLDTFYPERYVTITSSDPPYITPSIKCMLRRKIKLMRSVRVEKVAALAAKIGESIKNFNSVQLSRADVLSDPAVMWEKVRQLTGRSKNGGNTVSTPGITASFALHLIKTLHYITLDCYESVTTF